MRGLISLLFCLGMVLRVDAQDQRIEARLSQMRLEQKVAQMFIVSLFGDGLTRAERDFLQTWQPGGVVLLEKNVGDPRQTTEVTNALQRALTEMGAVPLLIAIDQEGGLIAHLRDGFTEWPVPMLLTATGDSELAYDVGMAQAVELRAVGVNMNLAPVADLNTNPNNPIIGRRAYGSYPQQVAPIISALIRGLQDGGVLATAKHFPGHGDTREDSHLELPTLFYGREALFGRELIPFIAAIEAASGAIMVGHIAFPELEPSGEVLPSSLSATIVGGLLRQELGYDGLIVTDALDMDAIDTRYRPERAALMAVEAGHDLIILGAHAGPEMQIRAMQGVVAAVEDGSIDEARIDASVRRILRAKARLGLLDDWRPLDPMTASARVNTEQHTQLVATLFRKGVTMVWDEGAYIPLAEGAQAVIVYPSTRPFIREACAQTGINATYIGVSASPTAEEVQWAQEAMRRADVGFVFTLNADTNRAQQDLVRALPAQKVVVIALWSPYDGLYFPDIAGYVVTYSPIPPSAMVACEVIGGAIKAIGQLSVALESP